MQRLIFSACLLLAVYSATVQSAALPQQQSSSSLRCVPALRTMPGLNEYHGRRGRRSNRARGQRCPPGTVMQFPQTATPQWRRERTRPPQRRNPSVNPYRGTAVEGGSASILFPGQQHHAFDNSVQDEPFINGKMHPSLYSPTTVVRLQPVASSVQDDFFVNGKMHPSLLRPTSVNRLEPIGNSVDEGFFVNGKMHPSLYRPTTISRLEPVLRQRITFPDELQQQRAHSVSRQPHRNTAFVNSRQQPSLLRSTVNRRVPTYNSQQHPTTNRGPSRWPSNEPFVNSKMHPSLLRPAPTQAHQYPSFQTQQTRPIGRWNHNHQWQHRPASNWPQQAPRRVLVFPGPSSSSSSNTWPQNEFFVNSKMHPSLLSPASIIY